MKIKFNIHFIYVLLSAVLWGTAGLFVRSVQSYNVSQMQIVLMRSVFTVIVLAVVVFFKDKSLFKINIRDYWIFFLSGLFSIVLMNYSYYMTMTYATLSVAAVLLYTAPFYVVIISSFLFKEKLSLFKISACITAFIGCCFVTGLFAVAQRITGKALFFGLLTGFGYSTYTIFGNLLLKRGYKTLTITFYVFLSSSIISIPFVNIKNTVTLFANQPISLFYLFLMAVFNTVLPYIFYTTGLSGVGPSTAPIIATLEPVMATVVGAVFFKESITVHTAIGIVLVLSSVIILNTKYVSLKANAKVNIGLSVKGKREDGYHLIDTVMQSVSLSDNITVLPSKKIFVFCSKRALSGEKNIAFKAARLFFEKTGINGGATVFIKKNIPSPAGLGGGSADAAAILLALDKLYETNLSKEALTEMALYLGADVPFFIDGGTKRAQGIGEILTSVIPLSQGYFVLIKDGKKQSTGQMYSKIDAEKYDDIDIDGIINAIKLDDRRMLSNKTQNAFEIFYDSKIKDKLYGTAPHFISLSGSGPVFFAYYKDKQKARSAYRLLSKDYKECYFAKTENKAVIFE